MEGAGSKIRLIFVTRKVDRGDALSGFIFTWLAKLSVLVERLEVICLERGDVSGLPANVSVSSMGKEKGKSRLWELFNYLRLLFKLIPKSGGIFVHMHPLYGIVAWLPAKLFGKKVVLWYTHKSVDLKLRLATFLVDTILTASRESFRLPSKKVKVAGHGIDLEKFKSQKPKSRIAEIKFRIVSVGRISPVKDYETLIKAIEILVKYKGVKDIKVEIYGRIGLPEHQSYLDSLVDFVRNAGLEDFVKFQGELNYEYVDEIYQEADLAVNLSQTGSLDKAVLEAAATATLVLTSNEAFEAPLKAISPDFFFERNNPEDLAERILQLKNGLPAGRNVLGRKLRAWVEQEHDLDSLARKIVLEFR